MGSGPGAHGDVFEKHQGLHGATRTDAHCRRPTSDGPLHVSVPMQVAHCQFVPALPWGSPELAR